MADEKLTLRLVVGTGQNKEEITLSDVPADIWGRFVKRCARLMPKDNPDTAWSKIIAGVVESEFLVKDVIVPYIKSQKAGEFTFLLSGIPLAARDAMDMYCSQANLTPTMLLALMYNSSITGDMHILNMKPPEEHTGYHMLVTSGISNEAWAAWSKFADEISKFADEHVSPEELIGHLFERVLWGDVTVRVDDQETDQNQNHENVEHPPMSKSVEEDVSDLKAKLEQVMEQMRNAKS